MIKNDSQNRRIGIFYDGNYFSRVSRYYNYHHERRSRISISGLHSFLKAQVARLESADPRFCQIVDAHYFRGRLKASEAGQRDVLLAERQFDDILVREGVTAHYLPLGPGGEKGVDVMLALEAFELATYKKYDVVVLISADGDFLPLVRKLNSIGVRVMVTAWDIKFCDAVGVERETRTSQALLEEAAYPLLMNKIIDADPDLDSCGFFLRPMLAMDPNSEVDQAAAKVDWAMVDSDASVDGVVALLKDTGGYGFIRPDGTSETIFFHASALIGHEFSDISVGNRVRITVGQTDKGWAARTVRLVSGSAVTMAQAQRMPLRIAAA